MDSHRIFYHISIRLILLSSVFLLTAASLAAQWAGLRSRRRGPAREPSDFLPTTVLGLLALLLSFSLSFALGRFEGRRQLAIREANTISTAYLRARLVAEPAGREIAGLMQAYLDERIAFYDAGENLRADAARQKAEALQQRIWAQVVTLTKTRRSPLESLFASSLNEMFDVANERNIALETTLPETLFWILLLVAAIGVGAYSFNVGYRQRLSATPFGILFLFSLLFALILDLDRPQTGQIRVGQDPLLAVRASLLHQ